VFLLGAILQKLVTREAPYGGQSLSDVLVKAALCESVKLPETVPQELASICNKAMSKNPRNRFEDALAFQHRHLAKRLASRRMKSTDCFSGVNKNSAALMPQTTSGKECDEAQDAFERRFGKGA